MRIRVRGNRTYTVLAAIVVLALCQAFLKLDVPKDVFVALFAAAIGFLRAGQGKASAILPLGLPFLLLSAGCVSDAQQAKYLESHDTYAAAVEQTYDPVCFEGTNLSFSVTGATRVRFTAPLNKIDAPQAPYDAGRDMVGLAKSAAQLGVFGYLGGKAIGKINADGADAAPAAAATP
jgi:hypothetical protein